MISSPTDQHLPIVNEWKIKPKAPEDFLAKFPAFPGVVLQLLWNRGLTTSDEIRAFFSPDLARDTHDPLSLLGMKEALARVEQALARKERIVILGDFDADGVCGATILFDILRRCGAGVSIYIPDRVGEGHGISRKSVEEFAEENVSLLITVDCGVSDVEEVAFAIERGIDTVIFDHHLVAESLPKAAAVVDAKRKDDRYPFKWLCGTGVAWKFVQALERSGAPKRYGLPQETELARQFLDLAAIATIADLVPLVGENRTLVKLGLEALRTTSRPGLKALLAVSGFDAQSALDERFVAFALAPRLNAANRMNRQDTAVHLLTARAYDEALGYAQLLDKKNTERQQAVERISKEIITTYKAMSLLPSMIIEANPEWPLGILGVVANKILEEFPRPVFLFWHDVSRGVYRGSARAPKGFDIVALMRLCPKDCFEEFGGHAQAAGASVLASRFDAFKAAMEELAGDVLADAAQSTRRTIEIEAELLPQEVADALARELQKFAPFGQENPAPKFLVRNLEIEGLRAVGNGQKHLQLSFLARGQTRNYIFPGIVFNHAQTTPFALRLGDRVDVVAELLYEEWRGRKELKLKIVDMKHA